MPRGYKQEPENTATLGKGAAKILAPKEEPGRVRNYIPSDEKPTPVEVAWHSRSLDGSKLKGTPNYIPAADAEPFDKPDPARMTFAEKQVYYEERRKEAEAAYLARQDKFAENTLEDAKKRLKVMNVANTIDLIQNAPIVLKRTYLQAELETQARKSVLERFGIKSAVPAPDPAEQSLD